MIEFLTAIVLTVIFYKKVKIKKSFLKIIFSLLFFILSLMISILIFHDGNSSNNNENGKSELSSDIKRNRKIIVDKIKSFPPNSTERFNNTLVYNEYGILEADMHHIQNNYCKKELESFKNANNDRTAYWKTYNGKFMTWDEFKISPTYTHHETQVNMSRDELDSCIFENIEQAKVYVPKEHIIKLG